MACRATSALAPPYMGMGMAWATLAAWQTATAWHWTGASINEPGLPCQLLRIQCYQMQTGHASCCAACMHAPGEVASIWHGFCRPGSWRQEDGSSEGFGMAMNMNIAQIQAMAADLGARTLGQVGIPVSPHVHTNRCWEGGGL